MDNHHWNSVQLFQIRSYQNDGNAVVHKLTTDQCRSFQRALDKTQKNPSG